MDAIRNELRTGKPTHGRDHIEKGIDSIKGLQRLLNEGNLSSQEQGVAQNYIDALIKALSGK